ncbi:hypothetical protein PV367_29355 [Streptomyces europaeiscabiei]|uniref:Uncharacterized protein n=1 Tax=Streptomyces europaeiscabiei TaxID=146819 RepID=A0AAJ2UPP5_9ACTN|nr:hypothetical protein [Streptomyces europaeiscabiei]MDX3133796.1 hypothetical protein [Streptomyces europaeiscabiei]
MAGRCQHARRGNGQALHGVGAEGDAVLGSPAGREAPFPAVG